MFFAPCSLALILGTESLIQKIYKKKKLHKKNAFKLILHKTSFFTHIKKNLFYKRSSHKNYNNLLNLKNS